MLTLRRLNAGTTIVLGILISAALGQNQSREQKIAATKTHASKPCYCTSILNDNVRPFSEGRAAIQINGLWGFVDHEGHLVIPPQFDDSESFIEGVADVRKSGAALSGYIDLKGNWAIPPQYQTAFSFSSGIAAVVSHHMTYGIDHNAKQVIEPRADLLLDGSVGYSGPTLMVSRKHVFQRWSAKGDLLTTFAPATAQDALTNYPLAANLSNTAEGLIAMHSGVGESKTGYVDLQGKWLIAPQFEEAQVFKSGHAIVKRDGKYGLIDRAGIWLVQPIWQSIEIQEDGLYRLEREEQANGQKQETSGWFDEQGSWKTSDRLLKRIMPGLFGVQAADTNDPEEYSDLVDASQTSVLQRIGGGALGEAFPSHFKAELVTTPHASQPAILLSYTNRGPSSKNAADEQALTYAVFFPVTHRLLHQNWSDEYSGKYAIALSNTSDETVPQMLIFRDTGETLNSSHDVLSFDEMRFGDAAGFAEMAPQEEGKYALVDRTGHPLSAQRFDEPNEFSEGIATICDSKTHQCGAVNEKGDVVIPFQYDRLESFHGGYVRAQKNGTDLFLNRSGQEFDWPKSYEEIEPSDTAPGLFIVAAGNKYGVVRGDGKIMAPLEYDSIKTLPNGLFKVGRNSGNEELYGLMNADGTVLQEPAYDSLDEIQYQTTSGLLVVRKTADGDKAILDSRGRLLTDFDIRDINDSSPNGPWLLVRRKQKQLLLSDGTLIPLPNDTENFLLLPDRSVLTETDDAYALAEAMGKPVSKWYRQLDYLGNRLWAAVDALGGQVLLGPDGQVRYRVPDDLFVIHMLHDADWKHTRLLAMYHNSTDYTLLDWENGGKRIALPNDARDVTAGDEFLSVSLQDGCAFLDMNGALVARVKASALEGLHEGLAVASAIDPKKDNPLRGLVDRQGRWIVSPQYDQILDVSEGRTWAETPLGEIDLLDEHGKIIGRRITRGRTQEWIGPQKRGQFRIASTPKKHATSR